jgi:hypothetical protein
MKLGLFQLAAASIGVAIAALAGGCGSSAPAACATGSAGQLAAAPAMPAAAGAQATSADVGTAAAKDEWAQGRYEPGLPNFHVVNANLYRGGKPEGSGFGRLKAMGVNTVVDLGYWFFEVDNLSDRQLSYVHIPFYTWRANDAQVMQFLRIATDRSRGTVYVHCRKGADRTGFMCAVYRVVVQGWSRDAAIAEMTQGGFGFDPQYQNLIQYIRGMDVASVRSRLGVGAVAAAGGPSAAGIQ